MSLLTQTREGISESMTLSGSPMRIPDGARILIVSDDNPDTERLKDVLREAGFVSECARSITEGCEAAKSGRFQVVVSTPRMWDGTWRRLIDIANHFDLLEWTEALKDGAFDVLDAMCEQPKAVESTKRALWAAYLKGGGPNPRVTSPQK